MDQIVAALAEFTPGPRLWSDPRSVDSGIYLFILGFFVVVFIIGVIFSLLTNRVARGNRLHHHLLALYGAWAAWLGGTGLLIIALRYANVPLFSKPLWTLLDIVAILIVAGHGIWYWIARYPDDYADYLEEQRRRRHIGPGRRRRR